MLELGALLTGLGCLIAYIGFRRGHFRSLGTHDTPNFTAPVAFLLLPFAAFAFYVFLLLRLARLEVELSLVPGLLLVAVLLAILGWLCFRGWRPVPDRLKPSWLLDRERAERRADFSLSAQPPVTMRSAMGALVLLAVLAVMTASTAVDLIWIDPDARSGGIAAGLLAIVSTVALLWAAVGQARRVWRLAHPAQRRRAAQLPWSGSGRHRVAARSPDTARSPREPESTCRAARNVSPRRGSPECSTALRRRTTGSARPTTTCSVSGSFDLVDLGPGDHVLDVACGRGAVLLPAARRVGDLGTVLGVDLSPAMVELAARSLADAGLRGDVEVMDAEHLTVGDATYDAALCAFGIFFFPHPERAVAELFRVLRPGGTVALSTWGADDARWAWEDDLVATLKPGRRAIVRAFDDPADLEERARRRRLRGRDLRGGRARGAVR